jgi:integrase
MNQLKGESEGLMATIRKRQGKKGVSWQIDYFDPTGKRVRRSFKKKKDAEAELGKRISLKAENRYLDVKKDYKNTLGELTEKYTVNYQIQVSFQNSKKTYLENFKEHFGKDTLLANIRYVELETYRNHLRQKPITIKKGDHEIIKGLRTDAAVNREMSCLHHIFTKAVEWEMMEQSPFDKGKSLLLKENNKRLRFLNEDEIHSLLDACPEYLRRIVVCAVNTGMRRGEILSLKWDQIRNGFIYLSKTKTKEPRQIPINDDLELLFKEIRKDQHLTSKHVFTNAGKQVRAIERAFGASLKRAGIQDFRFHDLRHTFASQVLLKGGSLKDIQELLGHKTMNMTLRYSHLTQEHKRTAVNLLNGLTATCHKTVTNLDVTKTAVV